MFCKNCGKEISSEYSFCVNCGTPVNEPVPTQTQDTPAPVQPVNPVTPKIYVDPPRPVTDPGKHDGDNALIFGILSIVLGFFCGAVVSIVFSILGITAANKAIKLSKEAGFDNGNARIGKILSIVGIVLNAVLIVLLIIYIVFIFILGVNGGF